MRGFLCQKISTNRNVLKGLARSPNTLPTKHNRPTTQHPLFKQVKFKSHSASNWKAWKYLFIAYSSRNNLYFFSLIFFAFQWGFRPSGIRRLIRPRGSRGIPTPNMKIAGQRYDFHQASVVKVDAQARLRQVLCHRTGFAHWRKKCKKMKNHKLVNQMHSCIFYVSIFTYTHFFFQ